MEIRFYKKRNGDSPANDFLMRFDGKLYVKAISVIKLLEEKGHMLREPYSKKIDEHIFELHIIQGNDHERILYFFREHAAYLTNGFIKKTNKTPVEELIRARKYRQDYLSGRKENQK